jgi:hypothetical protein
MKERPILFSGAMVRAILDGSKTQTRRIIKNPINALHTVGHPVKLLADWALSGLIEFDPSSCVVAFDVQCAVDDTRIAKTVCPYGVPGDRLWVRESGRMSEGRFFAYSATPGVARCADDKGFITVSPEEAQSWTPEQWRSGGWKSVPSIHMPRWASRITLEIVSVRVERLQDISEEDAIAEGVTVTKSHINNSRLFKECRPDLPYIAPAQQAYSELWESINGPGSWDANPWVWVVEFKKLEAAS